MRSWIETEWGAEVIAWAIPVDESTVFYEVITSEGQFIRAETVGDLIIALNEVRVSRFAPVPRPLRLVA
jgi:hypothetical protein